MSLQDVEETQKEVKWTTDVGVPSPTLMSYYQSLKDEQSWPWESFRRFVNNERKELLDFFGWDFDLDYKGKNCGIGRLGAEQSCRLHFNLGNIIVNIKGNPKLILEARIKLIHPL